MRFWIGMTCLALALACSNPRNTKLPQDLSAMDSIKPTIEKLPPEEKELLTGYIMRHTVGSALGMAFGQKSEPIPANTTIGKAIEEQRAYLEKERAREAEEKAKRDRAIAARKAFADQVAQAVSVRLVAIKVGAEDRFSISRRVDLTFEIENKGQKAISGLKGEAVLKDRFGDQLAEANLKFEKVIDPGKTITTSLGRSLNPFIPDDKKLAQAEAATTTMIFTPVIVLFADGTKAEIPTND